MSWPDRAPTLDRALKQAGLSNAQLARELKVDPSLISRFRSGERVPDADHLLHLARRGRVSIDEVLGLPQRTPPASPAKGEDWHELPKVAFAAAGDPLHDLPADTIWYAFHRSWVKRRAKGAIDDPQRLVVVQVDEKHLGESMLPTIRPGAIVVVDRGAGGNGIEQRDVREGAIYLVTPHPEAEEPPLTLKRVNVVGENVVLSSDNQDRARYPPIPVPLKGRRFQRIVIGKVIWIGQEEG